MTTNTTTDAPTNCEDCGRRLLLVRPDRTHCEACRPTIRDRWVAMTADQTDTRNQETR